MIWISLGLMLLALILMLALILFLPLKVEARAAFRCRFIKINLNFYALGMLPIKLEWLIRFEPHRGIVVRIRRRKGLEIVHTLGETKNNKNKNFKDALIQALVKTAVVNELELCGELGVKSNAAFSVFAAGGVQVLLENTLKVLMLNFIKYKGKSKIITAVYPNLSQNAFSLNLEGMFHLNLGILLIKAIAYKRNGGNNYASD